MEVGKISDGIQATIDLLESVPVRMKDIQATGYGLMAAIKNLKIIKEAVIKAENGEPFDNAGSSSENPGEKSTDNPKEVSGE